MKGKGKRLWSILLSLALVLGMLSGMAGVASAVQFENWNHQHTYGELKRYIDGGGIAWFRDDGTNKVSDIEVGENYNGTFTLHVVGEDTNGDYTGTYNPPTENIDFDLWVETGSVIPPLHFQPQSVTYDSGVRFTLGNDKWDLSPLCQNGKIKINGNELTYNSNYSYLSSANPGQYVKSGQSIYCYASSLQEGDNTVTFVNPDNTETSIRVKKTTVPGGYYSSDTYTIEQINDPTPTTYTVTWKNGNTVLKTDTGVEANAIPSYDGDTPTKDSDETNDYSFAGWATTENGTKLDTLPAVTENVTYYAVFTATPKAAAKKLYVRLVGEFEHIIVGQSINDGVDAVSSASTGSSGSYTEDETPVHVEYALVDQSVTKENVPKESWHRPDYFQNGNELTIDGAKSKIIIREKDAASGENPSGLGIDFNYFSGGMKLTGKAVKAGTYEVSVVLVDHQNRTDTSDALAFKIYTGNETLSHQLKYENCTQTADGKYMFDLVPWKITQFGGDNETVTVPKDVKAWYGSHGVAPTVNYGELGEVASRDSSRKPAEPTQALIIPSGCNLTMVNMKVHSGVKILVQDGGKLTLRQTTVDGIIEVEKGGTFSMDYNDHGTGEWLHGSMINGQLRMKDGSTLENARITAHGNYLAEYDNDTRRNSEPVVVTEGNVSIKGDVYILGENAPSGETGQPAILVKGTLNIPAGSTLAAYGGGDSNLTATGGDAIQLDGGTITGAGNLIAVGGYATNITSDSSKGKGGAAVSGTGEIAVANAYLEGGSCGAAATDQPSEALAGDITIADTTNCKLVTGSATLGDTSPQYWHGTGDDNGMVPDVQETLALIPENAPAGVQSGKTAVKVSAEWTDHRNHDHESVTALVKNRTGETVQTLTLNKDNNWTATASNLDANQSYTVSAASEGAQKLEVTKGVQDDAWADGQKGGIVEGKTYLITFEDGNKTYMLGAQGGTIGKAEWKEEAPKDVGDGFKWIPVKSVSTYYGEWYLMNQSGEKNTYLGMKQNGLDVVPCMYMKDSQTYYTLFADADGSLWNRYYSKNFLVAQGSLTTSGNDYTAFTFHEQKPSSTENFVVKVTPKLPAQYSAPIAIEGLVYTGAPQALVTEGSTDEGTMQYALGTKDKATQPYTTSIPTATDAGIYTVWYKAEGDSNHNDSTPASVTVTVTKAPLTITAKDKTIAYGDAPANAGVKYDSFVGGEDESVLTGELSYTCSYKQGDNSGEYTITPSGLTADNYEITFVDGKLTVNDLGEPVLNVTTEGEDGRLDIELDEKSAEKLLTKEELKDYKNGVPVTVYILVDKRSDSEVPTADKKLAEDFLKDGKIGQYLDLTLWVQVGDNDPRQITNAASAVTLKIAIPDALKVNGSGVERTFYLIRVHDGKATSLVSTTGNELEADSRLFSTYAIGYKDKTVKDDTQKTDTKKTDTTKKTTTKTSGKSPKTEDTAMLGLWVTMAGASATGLGALALGGKKRKHNREDNRTAGRRLKK